MQNIPFCVHNFCVYKVSVFLLVQCQMESCSNSLFITLLVLLLVKKQKTGVQVADTVIVCSLVIVYCYNVRLLGASGWGNCTG